MKRLFLLFSVLATFLILSLTVIAKISPDEQKIYYHLHQAYEWGELHYRNKCLLSKGGMDKHLGKLKYTEIDLVKSKFYGEFKMLLKFSKDLDKYQMADIEMLRMKIQTRADKLKLIHDKKKWHRDFVLCLK